MPRNLLADENENQEIRQPRNLLAEEPEESLGTAAMYAIPRIATDLAKSGYNFATQKLPDYYQAAKTEVPAFLNPIEAAKHPLHRAGQVLAGALEQGQNINRWPRNIVDYAANRLHLLPKEWEGKFPVGQDISPAIQNTFGEPQYHGEKLARGIGENFLNMANATTAINQLPHLTKRGAVNKLNQLRERMDALKKLESNEMVNLYHGTSEGAANKILENGLIPKRYAQDYATLTNSAPAALEYGARVSGEPELLRAIIPKSELNNYLHPQNTTNFIAPRGHEGAQIFGTKNPIPPKYISKVGYHDLDLINEPHNVSEKMLPKGQLNIKPELIEDMRQFLPDTDAYRTLLDEASTGDYNKLFNLQSDTGKYSNKLARDWFSAANRNKGKAGKESMNALLDAMHKDMQGKGLFKESELLRRGRRDYARYKKFKKVTNPLALLAAYALTPKNKIIETVKDMALRKIE